MQEVVKGLVSIIIPYYKARNFIGQTINSILSQTYESYEIILVDDGSNENDLEFYLTTNFDGVIFIGKNKNSGVSNTRNIGLKAAKGEFVVFLDSDDLLSKNFLEARFLALSNNEKYDFCSGNVTLLKNQNELKNNFWNNNSNYLIKDILLFNPNINSCPSNFMYKKSFLIKHSLKFNVELQSTADRYFLAEVLHFKGRYFSVSGSKSQLIYRIHNDSMSSTFSKSLIDDNMLYYQKLKNNNYVPKELLNDFNYKMRFILCGAYRKINEPKRVIQFLLLLIIKHPLRFLSDLYKKTIF